MAENNTATGQVGGAVNGAQGATGADTVKTTAQQNPPQQEGISQAELDRRINEAVETAKGKWEQSLPQKLEAAKNEGARLAKLSAEQRQQEEQRLEREKFEKEKAEFEHKSLVAECVKQLGENGLPVELAEMAAGNSAETAQANIKQLSEVWSKAIEAAVTKRVGGKEPKVSGGSNDKGMGSFFDIIKENQRH